MAMRYRLVAALCILTTASASAQCPDGTPKPCALPRATTPPVKAVRARQIVLLPFRNVTRTPANDWLVTGAPLLLGEILGQYRELQVVPEPKLTATRRRLGIGTDVIPDAAQRRRIAEETGGWTSVTGNIVALGNTVRITAEAFDAASTDIVARASAEVPAGADLRAAFERVAVQLLQPAGVVQGGTPTDAIALSTRSIEAFRAYSEGIAQMQRGDYSRAEAAFREAVRQDSNFAIAWVKLGTVTVQTRGLADLVNPFGMAAQYVDRAARATSWVPARTAAGIKGIHALFYGDVARARAVADSLIATDPEDIDAHQWMATIHYFDSRMAPGTGRRLGSMTQSIEHSKWVLTRDPGRAEVYLIPALIYASAAGYLGGNVGTRQRPLPTLGAELRTPLDVEYRITVQDTVVLVLASEFEKWTAEQRAAAHARAIDAGRGWAARWISANPTGPEAYIWASLFEDLAGDYEKSLEHLERSVALGGSSGLENLRARRAFLYEMTGRSVQAERLTDSLINAGALRAPYFNSWLDRSRAVIPAVVLRSKQWAKAVAVSRMIDSLAPVCFVLDAWMSGTSFAIPTPKLRAISDTVAGHFIDAWRSAGRCAGDWSWGFGDPATYPQRPDAARRLVAAAESLHARGDPGGYFGLRIAALLDSARRPEILRIPWLEPLGKSIELGSTLDDGRAIIEGDSLVVTLRYTGSDRVLIVTKNGMMSRTISFRTLPAGPDSAIVAFSLSRQGRFADTTTYGSLPDFIAQLQKSNAVLHQRGRPMVEGPVAVTASDDVLRATIRGPLVTTLKAARPTSGRFTSLCSLMSTGICTPRTITIEYR
jgi:tetratricopeptide (TPR) repeat protein